ncbi:putative periplasmic lipoprotein [Glaciibacter psychrotolerans]|uniref:Uncharacterized protein n=1 Tax=Glaciibacter psychrotolerans TaxID=670054 RepID=A0A7Z0ED04_9MICO|nr:hypothetical protein [Leifsonia psychrotolerans]NYJ19213.1 hypothetical protein [Leifsonia psychrotolerans]
MNKILPAIAAVFLLAGCSSAVEPVATPTPTAEVVANQDACATFGEVTVDLAEVIVNPPADKTLIEATDGMVQRFDAAYLVSEGDVKARIGKTMDELPSSGLHMLYLDGEDYLANIAAVGRACEAEGAKMKIVGWS